MSEFQENEKVLEEIKNLKISIMPLFHFMNDFRELKLKNKISSESHVNLLNLLSTNIKEDVIKDILALNQPLKSSIDDLKSKIESNQKEMYNKFDYLSNNLLEFDTITTQMNESMNHVRGHLNKFYDKIDVIKKEIDEKSSVEEINDVKQRMKFFAYQNDLENLKGDVIEKASRESVDRIYRNLNKIEGNITNYIDKNHLDDIKRDIKLDIEAYIDLNCMLREEFLSFKESSALIKQKADEDFKGLIHKIDIQYRNTKESIEKNRNKLLSKPWRKETDKIQKEMTSFAKIVDLKDLESSVFPKIVEFSDKIDAFTSKISDFEAILLRYDEILLEKSSKDDIKYLKSQLELFASHKDFTETTQSFKQKLRSLDGDIEELNCFVKVLESSTTSISNRLELLKKDNKEVANVASSLIQIKEEIKEKADKIDFHQVLDNMGRKEDFERLQEKFEVFQKQIELGAVLSKTLCRTLISSGDSTNSIIQLRQDVFRKMSSLISWINGEGPRVKSTGPSRGSPLVRPELYLCREESLKSLAKTTRNNTAIVKARPARYTPRPVLSSFDLPQLLGGSLQ